ncbi:proline dehydrogenase family protein [Candidatus Micrarchaeota archaeon]|nr:proline dehydrogenase family protein [Candidatus Micrarchaeota archaeon]
MIVKRKMAEVGYRVWSAAGIENGLKHADKLQRRGGGAILNILGEHHHSEKAVERDIQSYYDLIDRIAEHRVKTGRQWARSNARISIKPTQFGFHSIAPEGGRSKFTMENLWAIINYATKNGIKVEMDIEDSSSHNFTIRAYREFARRLNVGGRNGMLALALQANYPRNHALGLMRRVLSLAENQKIPVGLRLCKGIYQPPNDPNALSEQTHLASILQNYRSMVVLSHNFQVQHPGLLKIAMASHRDDMHDLADTLVKDHETQMLKGIRGPFKRMLAREGKGIWEYTPIAISSTEKTKKPRNIFKRVGRSWRIERERQQSAGAYAERRFGKAMKLLWRTGTDYVTPKYFPPIRIGKKRSREE